jgi:hypothetical protein
MVLGIVSEVKEDRYKVTFDDGEIFNNIRY